VPSVATLEGAAQTDVKELDKMKQVMRDSFMIALDRKKAEEAEA